MATTAKNTIVRSPKPYRPIESAKNFISTAISWNQGDLLYLDTTNHLIKPIAADADTAYFLGVATQTIVSGKEKSPYTTDVDASQAISDVAGPMAGVEITVILNSGDTFHPGDLVYPVGASGGTQTVSTSSNTSARKACGYFVGAQATGDGTKTGVIRIESQYPKTY